MDASLKSKPSDVSQSILPASESVKMVSTSHLNYFKNRLWHSNGVNYVRGEATSGKFE